VVCIVVDRGELVRGRDFDVEGAGDIFRFMHGLPPDVVEYVLLHDEIRFLGDRAGEPQPWRAGAFKKREGEWVPHQQPPVRYDDARDYATFAQFCDHCLGDLLAALGPVTAIEVFSTLYALIEPWDALEHDAVFALLGRRCAPHRRAARLRTFRARQE
jgi:hypothetical protein